MRALPVVGAALCVWASLGCGGGSGVTDDGGTDGGPTLDAPADAPVEAAGGDAGAYPAFAPDMPRVVDNGGATLSAPKVVTVTWNADPNQAALDAFGDGIGGSAFWTATTSEYGIGPAKSAHVHVATAPPSTMSAGALDTFVADQVASAPGDGWPANDAQTAYVVYVPEAMELTSNGQNDCNNEDGYHDETYTSTIPHIVYAVINEGCHDTTDVVAFSTETASHEIVESVTDPHAETDLGWTFFDADHYAWEVWNTGQDELADACEYFSEALYQSTAPLPYWLQRSWSNAGAAAGHDPCVPAPAGAYYNVAPLGLDSITLTVNKASVTTKGYSIGVGTKRTVQLGLYSDGPHAPWTIDVVEGDGFSTVASPRLTISPQATSGRNGDVIGVDITANATKASGVLVTVVSTAPNEPVHYMPFLVATP